MRFVNIKGFARKVRTFGNGVRADLLRLDRAFRAEPFLFLEGSPMATAVYLVPVRREGKKVWSMRWPIGVTPEGKPIYRQESCRTSDKKTARAMRQRKFDEVNGLMQTESTAAKMAWDEFVQADLEMLKARQRAEATIDITTRTLNEFNRLCAPATPFDVTRAMAENFVAKRAGEVGAASINKELRSLKAVFSRAVRRDLLPLNPFGRVDKLREPEKVKRILSDNELTKLLPELKGRDHSVYGAALVSLTTAMRIGELANLMCEHVDLDTGDVHLVNRADWRTKSTRNRYEWLPEFVRDVLRPLVKNSSNGYVFADRDPDKWYFRAGDVFAAAVKAAEIAHCTLHDLRETALTRMAEGGAGVWVLQSIAGHSTPNVTAKHYVGVGREAVRSVISQHGERLKLVAVGA